MAKKKKEAFKAVDTISKELDVVDNFVLKHWKRYSVVALVFVIVLGVVLFVVKIQKENSVRASEEIMSATTIPQLQTVIKKYPQNGSIKLAQLQLAAQYFDNKNYREAISTYDNIINSSTTGNYSAELAKINKGYVLEAEGKNKKAAKLFMNLSNNSDISEIIRCQAYYSAGRIYHTLGKNDIAASMLEKATAEKGNCQLWPEMAKNLLCKIK